jgi:hypothetical protein
MNGILREGKINPSLSAVNPEYARFGDGVYVSDIVPGTMTNAQLGNRFISIPNKYVYTHYVAIDTSGLTVIFNRPHNFTIPTQVPLGISDRLRGAGKN